MNDYVKNGRDASGKFVKGNAGGPGNPFARQMASFRQRLMDAVTPDVEAIAFHLVLLARNGNMEALKLLFSYIMGKPTHTIDPDRLDHDELAMHKNGRTTVEDIEKVLDNMPVKHAVEFSRISKEAFYDRQVEVGEEKRRKAAERREIREEQRRCREEQLSPMYEMDPSSLNDELELRDESDAPSGFRRELLKRFTQRFKEEFGIEYPVSVEDLLREESLPPAAHPSSNGGSAERAPSSNGRAPSINGGSAERAPSSNGVR